MPAARRRLPRTLPSAPPCSLPPAGSPDARGTLGRRGRSQRGRRPRVAAAEVAGCKLAGGCGGGQLAVLVRQESVDHRLLLGQLLRQLRRHLLRLRRLAAQQAPPPQHVQAQRQHHCGQGWTDVRGVGCQPGGWARGGWALGGSAQLPTPRRQPRAPHPDRRPRRPRWPPRARLRRRPRQKRMREPKSCLPFGCCRLGAHCHAFHCSRTAAAKALRGCCRGCCRHRRARRCHGGP